MRTAKNIIKDLPLNINDAARLILEATEELGAQAPEQGRIIIPASGSKTGGGRAVPLRKKKQLQGVALRIPRNWRQHWRAL